MRQVALFDAEKRCVHMRSRAMYGRTTKSCLVAGALTLGIGPASLDPSTHTDHALDAGKTPVTVEVFA